MLLNVKLCSIFKQGMLIIKIEKVDQINLKLKSSDLK